MPEKKNKKMDTTVVVAIIGLIGSLAAALLASPLLPKLLGEETPAVKEVVTTVIVTAEASGEAPMVRRENLVFSNDFGSGNASGFAFNSEEWQVGKEKNNPLLEMNGLDTESEIAVFGPNDFSNGRINFRLNYRGLDWFLLDFRNVTGAQKYSLYFSPSDGEIKLGYGNAANNWDFEAFDGNSLRPFQFSEKVWYEVILEVEGEQMTVWVDGNKILTGTDTRLTQGSMDFALFGNGTVWLDDVEVWEYTYEPQ